MPIVPGSPESQVLVPGAPVHAASPESQRLEGEAFTQFGHGMFQLGSELAAEAHKQKKQHDYVTEQLALQEVRKAGIGQMAQIENAAPIEGDADGSQQVKKFYENMQDPISTVADTIQDPEVKRGFLAKANDYANDTAKEVYAKEIAKRAKQNDALQTKLVSQYSQFARNDVTQTDFAFKKAEIDIRNNPNIPDAVKEQQVLKAQQGILLDAVDGALERKRYDQAQIALTQFSPGVFDPKEKQVVLDKIQNTQIHDQTVSLNQLSLKEKMDAKFRADQEQILVNQHSAALQLAGNDELRRAPILAQIGLDKIAGKIDAQKADALMGNKVFGAKADAQFDTQVMEQVFKDHNFAKAIEDTQQAMGHQISPEKAASITTRLTELSMRIRQDPQHLQLIKDGESLIKAMASDSILAPLDSLSKKELLTKINETVQDYHKAISENPKIDPTNYSRYLINDRFGARTSFIRGQENLLNFSSPEGADKEKQRLFEEYKSIKDRGLMTKTLEKKYLGNLQKVEAEKQRILLTKPGSSAPQAPGTVAPTRGK